MNRRGRVYLIGAGPGDPGLITLRGRDALAAADVVVYDYLANDRLLMHVRPTAERIYVGKKGTGEKAARQEEINRILVTRAQEGKVVARLKGGDPFIFGRGGEEAEALARAGLPFEVIPGVSAATGVPAYAGIPLTHREWTSTVAFVTGHEEPGKEESAIDWKALSSAAGTLVFLMGVARLAEIAAQLIRAGRDPRTPAAVIRWGTRPEQETVTAPLEEVAKRAAERGLQPPALLVVGEVVRLRERLNWFDNRPLFGRRVAVTRAREQASELVERLSFYGAEVSEFPTIRLEPPSDFSALDGALRDPTRYDWVIFTSANAVRVVLDRLWGMGKDARALAGVRLAAIGSATAVALEQRGLRVDIVPKEFRAEGLAAALEGEDFTGKRVLLPRAREAREVLPGELRRRGARVEVVEAYRTVPPKEDRGPMVEELRRGRIAAITFTSSSTVKNFAAIMEGEGPLPELLKGVAVACIGPITRDTAMQYGLSVAIMPEEYTIAALADAMADYFSRAPRPSGSGA